MNIAPPPEMRRTTWKPYFSAFSGSTSFLTDWKLPMTTAALVPLPDAQRRCAGAVADLLGEHLVEREVHERAQRAGVHELPVVVAPAGGLLQRTADRGRHRLRREPEQLRAVGKRGLHGGGERAGVGLGEEPVDGGVDRAERLVGLEEEVAGQPEAADPAVHDIQVDDDQLAAGHLEFAVHAPSLVRQTLR